MEAELFAATAFAPCTEWPRTVMRGKPRKLTSGPESVPKSARRTEPSPRFPRFAARPKGVAAQRRVWGSQEGAREPYGALAPFCPGRWAPALPGRRRRPLTTLCHGEHPPSREGVNLASSGGPLYRRKISRLLTVKQKGRSSPAAARPPEQRKVYRLLTVKKGEGAPRLWKKGLTDPCWVWYDFIMIK